MYDNDYVILFDENGQPYIAHSQIITNLKKGAKSVAKLVDGTKTRYFSTQKELQAYYNKGKQKVSQVASKARSAASNAYSNVRSTATKAYKSAKKAAWKAADNLGVDEAIVRKRAKDTMKKQNDDMTRTDYMVANNKFAKTPLGKAEKAVRTAIDTTKRYAKITISEMDHYLDNAKDKSGDLINKGRTMYEDARETARNVGDKAAEFSNRAIDLVTSRDEKRALDTARNEYEKVRGTGGSEESDAYWAQREAEANYDRTIGGRVGSAASSVSSAAKNAASSVGTAAKNAASSVGNAATSVGNAAKSAADRVTGKTKAQAQSAYDKALREYEKVRGTGSGEESDAYWALREAELALERAGGKIKK